jgi:hypothetical protein
MSGDQPRCVGPHHCAADYIGQRAAYWLSGGQALRVVCMIKAGWGHTGPSLLQKVNIMARGAGCRMKRDRTELTAFVTFASDELLSWFIYRASMCSFGAVFCHP